MKNTLVLLVRKTHLSAKEYKNFVSLEIPPLLSGMIRTLGVKRKPIVYFTMMSFKLPYRPGFGEPCLFTVGAIYVDRLLSTA